MFKDTIIIISGVTYVHYLENLKRLIELRGGAYKELSPQDALLALEHLHSARAIVTIHSMLPSVFKVLDALRGVVPSLTVQDGIIEYKHSMHSGSSGVLRYRPLHTDHIACFGEHSRLLLESHGVSSERIHVTGSPRFVWHTPDVFPSTGSILIASANRPGFKRFEVISFYRMLDRAVTALSKRGYELRFRLGMATAAGKSASVECFRAELGDEMVARILALPQSTSTLAEDFAQSRILLTTPSTISLEAMAYGLPVAHFLTDDDTVYLHPAWHIRPFSNVLAVAKDMMNPAELKKNYQLMILHENVLPGDAAGRILELIDKIAIQPQPGAA